MTLARCQLTVQDEDGNVVDGATITVRRVSPGKPLAGALYSDTEATTPLGNPFVAADGADASFCVAGGTYEITATLGGFSRTWPDVGVGLAQSSDGVSEVGVKFLWDTGTSDADPGSGEIRANNASLASATFLYVSKFNRGGDNISAFLLSLDDGTGGTIALDIGGGGESQALFSVTAVTNATNYVKLAVSAHAGATAIGAGTFVALAFSRTGADGSDPGVLFNWDTGTSDADPGAGDIRANNASLASATFLYASKTSRGGSNVANFLLDLADSTSALKGFLILTRSSDAAQAIVGVTSVTDATDYVKIGLSGHAGATSFSALDPISFQFLRAGDQGFNPLVGKQLGYGDIINGTLVESNGSSATTYALKTLAGADPSAADPVLICFRNATVGTGNYVYRTVEAALSLTIPSGATMGFVNATAARLWIIAIDNAGAVELAAINCLSGTNIYPLGRFPIITTTAIGTGADSAHVPYSASARTSVAYTILGYASYESGLATAGTWNASPTRIQLYGDGVPLPGDRIQRQFTQSGAVATGTAVFPTDDTTPDITDGNEYMTLAITPTSAGNILIVEMQGHLSHSADNFMHLAMFQDATSAALASTGVFTGAATNAGLRMKHAMLAGTTSSTTLRMRGGGASGTTTTFNGFGGARKDGGKLNSYIDIEELMA